MERPLIYELINAAKEALKPQHPDAVTKDTVVTQKTQLQYWTNAKRIFGVDTEAGKIIPPTNPEVVIAAVRSANTLSTLRMHARSVRHASLLALSALLKRADIAQRNGNGALGFALADDVLVQLGNDFLGCHVLWARAVFNPGFQ